MKRISCLISRNFPTMKKHHVVPSSNTPLGTTNKHPMKRKHRHKKHTSKHFNLNKVATYLLSDSHMYNPLVSPQPSFDFPPPKQILTSPGIQEDVAIPVKGRHKKLIEKVVDFLEADCYMYSPLITKSYVANADSGGEMQRGSAVGEGGDLSSQLGARPVVKKTTISSSYCESVKHMVR